MLILIETAAGYGLFKVKDSKLLSMDVDSLCETLSESSNIRDRISLHAFTKFDQTNEAIEEVNSMLESKLGKKLSGFLKKNIVKMGITDQLAVCDKALGAAIKEKFKIDIAFNATTHELIRGVRAQLAELIDGLSEKEIMPMSLSLAHSLSRFRLKFSPDKVDTMIVQAIGLLDDLDKELNNFAMRLKEWYGWHFPELAKICPENLVYAKLTKAIGFRSNTQNVDLKGILDEGTEADVKAAAEVSMGTEIADDDLENILELADRVEELAEYRVELSSYLKYRMNTLAPNLTHMVGELIGARLISHSSSLMNLAKHPSSTVQILGAEKALFRAFKTKNPTPKYGLIYHAALVGQSLPKLKGKISRVLAAKISLCTRVDALGDQTGPTVAIPNRQYVEMRLEQLTKDLNNNVSRTPLKRPQQMRYEPERGNMKDKFKAYDLSRDVVLPTSTSESKEAAKPSISSLQTSMALKTEEKGIEKMIKSESIQKLDKKQKKQQKEEEKHQKTDEKDEKKKGKKEKKKEEKQKDEAKASSVTASQLEDATVKSSKKRKIEDMQAAVEVETSEKKKKKHQLEASGGNEDNISEDTLKKKNKQKKKKLKE